MRAWIPLLAGVLLACADARAAPVALVDIEGPIGPATSAHVTRAHERAEAMGAPAILLRLDTPGGLDSAMRDITKTVLAARIPVICWVGPSGARAASAGTFILYACPLAAMAPGTNLGAATPIALGGRPAETRQDGTPVKDPAETKAVNDAVAYIRSLAERHGRNADWAEQAVRGGESLSAARALELDVIDLLAADRDALLKSVDGRTLQTGAGPVTLAIGNATVERIEPGWRLELLAVLSNPAVAYLLLLVGIYGLLLEGYSPGAILPGVVGAISLLLAAYALQMLPVNFAGLALIVLGVVMLIAEAFAPSFGLLGLGGIVAFVLGSVLLMDSDVPGYQIPLGLISGIAVVGVALLAALVWLLAKARRARVTTGGEALVGATVLTLEPVETEGWAEFQGERWRIRTSAPLRAGQPARVRFRDGLVLDVEPEPSSPTQPDSR